MDTVSVLFDGLKIVFGFFLLVFLPVFYLTLIFFPPSTDLSIVNRLKYSLVLSISSVIALVLIMDFVLGVNITLRSVALFVCVFSEIALIFWWCARWYLNSQLKKGWDPRLSADYQWLQGYYTREINAARDRFRQDTRTLVVYHEHQQAGLNLIDHSYLLDVGEEIAIQQVIENKLKVTDSVIVQPPYPQTRYFELNIREYKEDGLSLVDDLQIYPVLVTKKTDRSILGSVLKRGAIHITERIHQKTSTTEVQWICSHDFHIFAIIHADDTLDQMVDRILGKLDEITISLKSGIHISSYAEDRQILRDAFGAVIEKPRITPVEPLEITQQSEPQISTEPKEIPKLPVIQPGVESLEIPKRPVVLTVVEPEEISERPVIQESAEPKEISKPPVIQASAEPKEIPKLPVIQPGVESKEIPKRPIVLTGVEPKEITKPPVVKTRVEPKEIPKRPEVLTGVEPKEITKPSVVKTRVESKEIPKRPVVRTVVEPKEISKPPVVQPGVESKEIPKRPIVLTGVEPKEITKPPVVKTRVEPKEIPKRPEVLTGVEPKEITKPPVVQTRVEPTEIPKRPEVLTGFEPKEMPQPPDVLEDFELKEIQKRPTVQTGVDSTQIVRLLEIQFSVEPQEVFRHPPVQHKVERKETTQPPKDQHNVEQREIQKHPKVPISIEPKVRDQRKLQKEILRDLNVFGITPDSFGKSKKNIENIIIPKKADVNKKLAEVKEEVQDLDWLYE